MCEIHYGQTNPHACMQTRDQNIILQVNNVCKKFGGLVALKDVSLAVEGGEIRGLIGPNGSGKTTLLNVISGIYNCDGGSILFNGQRIDKLQSHQIAKMGIGRSFQIAKLFDGMSVLENVLVPVLAMKLYRTKQEVEQKCLDTLGLCGLLDLKDEYARNLSGGQQKLLEIARCFAAEHKLVLLDEPFLGIHIVLKQTIKRVIKEMQSRSVAVLIVSHDMPSVMDMCGNISVLASGQIITEGNKQQITTNKEVVTAYLGESGS